MARTSRKPRRARSGPRSSRMVFGRRNYLLLLLGIGLVVVGYLVMSLDNDVDGFLSLYVAPLLILGGYVEVIYAILRRPEEETASA